MLRTCQHAYAHTNIQACMLSLSIAWPHSYAWAFISEQMSLYPAAFCLIPGSSTYKPEQAERVQRQAAASHGSDSSSDPSEEVLDDPTNIALSQRAPAHLQERGALAPHGDPLLQAAQAKQPADVEEPLPVREMPSKQGDWITKRGKIGRTWHASSFHSFNSSIGTGCIRYPY